MRVAGSESREIPPDDGARDSRFLHQVDSRLLLDLIQYALDGFITKSPSPRATLKNETIQEV